MILKKLTIILVSVFLCSCASSKKASSERVNHVVLCWLKDSGNKEQRQKLIEESLKFESIPGVLEVRAGEVVKSDRPIVDSSYDVAIFLSYKSVDDLKTYLIHPDHKKAVKEVLRPLVKKVLVYDFIENP